MRLPPLALACVLAAYATVLLVSSPWTQTLVKGSSQDVVPLGDFGSFYASGLAASRGLDPYEVYPLTLHAELGRGQGAAPNLNAPLSVAVFELLTLADPSSARLIWFVASLVGYAAMLGALAVVCPRSRDPLRFAWAMAMTGFIETIGLGQVYIFLALPTTLAWLGMRRRPVASAALIGFVAAFKPNFVIWPLLLLLAGYRRVGIAALVWTLVFGLVPVALYGPSIYFQWLDGIRLEPINPQVANASVGGLVVRDGAPLWLGAAVCALTLVVVALGVWTRRQSQSATNGLSLVGLLLASPLAWVGYSVFLLPIVAKRRGSVALVIAAALLCIPRLPLQQWADSSWLIQVTLGAAYNVAWLLLAFEARHLGAEQVSADT